MMTQREITTIKRRIRAMTALWKDRLGIGRYNIDLSYRMGILELNGAAQKDTAASALVHWQYEDAFIEFRIDVLCDLDDERLERVVLHELCHVLVNEMRDYRFYDPAGQTEIEHEERVCTMLTNSLLWTFDAGRKLR